MYFVASSLLSQNTDLIQSHLKESKGGVDLFPCTIPMLCRIMQVSKAWRDIIADDRVWQGMGDRLGVIFSEHRHVQWVRHKPCKKEQVKDFYNEVVSTAYNARYTLSKFTDEIIRLRKSFNYDHILRLKRINETKGRIIFWLLLDMEEKETSNDLDVSRCMLFTLPNILEFLSNLTSLNVEFNRLSQIPDSIGKLPELIYLNLRKNQLTFLPDAMKNLTNLLTLDLAANDLEDVPDWIGNLARLDTLRVSYNHLSSLPATVEHLTNLSELRLDGNKLAEVPNTIEKLKKLTILNLESNALRRIPNFLYRMTNLTSLEID